MIVFLDVDGVLNSHQPHPNGYCGISPECAQRFNQLLNEFPEIKLVISSSWRYLVHSGSMTITGLENLFLSHGLWFRDKIEGITRKDKEIDIDEWDSREEQIIEYVNAAGLKRWIVIDDLPLTIDNFYRTNGETGLTDTDIHHIKLILEWNRENPINV